MEDERAEKLRRSAEKGKRRPEEYGMDRYVRVRVGEASYPSREHVALRSSCEHVSICSPSLSLFRSRSPVSMHCLLSTVLPINLMNLLS